MFLQYIPYLPTDVPVHVQAKADLKGVITISEEILNKPVIVISSNLDKYIDYMKIPAFKKDQTWLIV